MVSGDKNNNDDIFVFDRSTKTTKRLSVDAYGMEGNGNSFSPSISADGLYVTFESDATNLVLGDLNRKRDVFIVPNPFIPSDVRIALQAGQVFSGLNIGLEPNPGSIHGKLFEDTVSNGIYDDGEWRRHDVFDPLIKTTLNPETNLQQWRR